MFGIVFQNCGNYFMTNLVIHLIHQDKNQLANGLLDSRICTWLNANLSNFVNYEPLCNQCVVACETLLVNTMAKFSHGFLHKLQKK
jgi:hypothetical protein